MDLGRLPEARYRTSERFLSEQEVSQEDIDYVISRIGTFGEDNRAGIPRTLHRVSAIRNRSGKVIGLTCRVGRAVFGTIAILRDLIEAGKSVLLLGRPGVGKTTMLRETARVLAEELRKRVVIVDTSNEIAGDGDIPHPGIGRARRMQVPRPAEQHGVMIEAVENHMPEVIVIDEIGTELEAQAARTIAERGVQLIGTAHGNTLDNLMVNPTLSDLIGGIQAVTLGDEEARRRGTQKTVLERKAPPTFDVLVELQAWDRVLVYPDVAAAVDGMLRQEEPPHEQRIRDADGQIQMQTGGGPPGGSPRRQRNDAPHEASFSGYGGRRGRHENLVDMTANPGPRRSNTWRERLNERKTVVNGRDHHEANGTTVAPTVTPPTQQRIYPFGVSRDRLERAIANLRVPAIIVRELSEATLVMTLKNYYRQGATRMQAAQERNVPIYVLRNNTIMQMERQLADLFNIRYDESERNLLPARDEETEAQLETERAINQVLNGERQAVELSPRNNFIRKLQHQLAERYNVRSESQGREPNRRVKVYR